MSKNFLTIIIVVILFLAGWLYYQFYLPFSPGEPLKVFIIEKGSGLSEIASQLKQEGLIRSRLFFSFYVFLKGSQSDLKAGEYNLSPSMNISEIAGQIIQGNIAGTKITIIEGWNIRDIAAYLGGKGICSKESFLEAVNFSAGVEGEFDFLSDKPEKTNLEGYLFPDTYWVKQTADADDVIKILLTNFGNKLTPAIREEINAQGKTIFEIITMASLIEKEVATDSDRRVVSGIFWKRLENHYPLQSCATIAYALGFDKWRYSVEDTQIDSPYNTYKYAGLPAGPIANPGLSAIKAAIEPEASDYNYFMSKSDGETVFSKTLQEHNIAIQKYLK